MILEKNLRSAINLISTWFVFSSRGAFCSTWFGLQKIWFSFLISVFIWFLVGKILGCLRMLETARQVFGSKQFCNMSKVELCLRLTAVYQWITSNFEWSEVSTIMFICNSSNRNLSESQLGTSACKKIEPHWSAIKSQKHSSDFVIA